VLETLLRIDRALQALPPRMRETFLLSQLDGLTYSTIAAQLNVSLGSVRKYMLKAASAFLVSWFLGFLVSWFLGFLVSWLLGFLVSWFLGCLVSWLLGC